MTENELERYMRQHYRSVYRTALCRCKDPQDADDVAQDVFLKLYTCNEKFEDDDHVKAWLLRCAINHSIDVLRSRKRRNTVSLDAAADKAHYDDKDEDGVQNYREFDSFYFEEYGMDPAKIKEVTYIYYDVTVSGSLGSSTKQKSMWIFKYEGRWYSFYMPRFGLSLA